MGHKNQTPAPFAGLVLLLAAAFTGAVLGLFFLSGGVPAGRTLAAVQFPGTPWQEERVDAPGMLEGEVLDLNTASQGDLSRLPGIGAARAADIADWRAAHGGFRSAEEVMEVYGIGPGIFARIQPYITVSPQGERGGDYGADLGG